MNGNMWTITCPACAKILRQPEEGGDRPFQCPACGAVFQYPEGSAELTNIAKTGTDHRIQATNSEADFHPGPEIRAGLPPPTKGQNETQPASKTLDNAFAFGFLGAFVLTIALGALNISPFLFLVLGLSGTLIVLMWLMWLMGAFDRKKLHMPEEPEENLPGNSISYPAENSSEQIKKP
jgi:ribosomal protein S27E